MEYYVLIICICAYACGWLIYYNWFDFTFVEVEAEACPLVINKMELPHSEDLLILDLVACFCGYQVTHRKWWSNTPAGTVSAVVIIKVRKHEVPKIRERAVASLMSMRWNGVKVNVSTK